MKPLFLLLLLTPALAFSQDTDLVPLTKQHQFHKEVDAETIQKRRQLENEKTDSVEIEFTLDTFRIERYIKKCRNSIADQTTYSMAHWPSLTAERYDSLLNKYYRKLSAILGGDEKKALTDAQRAWLTFRDSEMKLNYTLGINGGSIQQINNAEEYLSLVERRTIEIFHYYYDRVIR